MLNIANIDKALKTLAVNKRSRFNAHQVAFLSFNSDVNEVYNYLVSREPFVLYRKYEVLCPNRSDSAAAYSNREQIPKGWIECRICGDEFIPDPNHIHIVFYFSDTYLKQVEEEVEAEKKQYRPLMVMS
jgi:hypothetical protein